jgi:hypothetical protein
VVQCIKVDISSLQYLRNRVVAEKVQAAKYWRPGLGIGR